MNQLLTLISFLSVSITPAMLADVPAPPVNQKLGLPDTVFGGLVEADCRGCHNQSPPAGYPVDPTYLPDRHHMKVNTPIDLTTSEAPNGDPNGDGLYECLSCHSVVWTGDQYELDPNFTDCLLCHLPSADITVHHRTPQAQAADCQHCHGGLIDNPGDGHTIPTYDPSLVTPWPSDKPYGDETMVNSLGVEAGNCNFCHSSGNADGTPSPDDEFGHMVYNNSNTHHGTGFVNDSTKCVWCHDTADPESAPIRRCEACHGINSIHNIQTNAAGDTGELITPGAEDPGYGHIGSQNDCWGCHGFSAASIAYNPAGMFLTANLESISVSSMTAGLENSIVLVGSGFVSNVEDPLDPGTYFQVGADVLLTDKGGNLTVVTPTSVAPDRMEAMIPVTVVAGIYQIAAVKGDVAGGNFRASNPLTLTLTPGMILDAATITLK